MEKNNVNSSYKHSQFANVIRSHNKLQTKSRTAAIDAHTHASKSKLTLLNLSKLKSCKAEESTLASRNARKKLQESRDDSTKFLQRSRSNLDVPRQTRSASTSPSAWALSPGRPLHPFSTQQPFSVPNSHVTSAKSKTDKVSSTGVNVRGVLKYFTKKKRVSHLQEEEYHHQLRIMHNRLLQWRFANARAEVSMAALKRIAQKKLFNVWLRTSIMRDFIVEKRILVQKCKRGIKLCHILGSEISLLKEWARLEKKNCEAVGRLARKLSAITLCLPLDQDSKADETAFQETMSMATELMESIETMITNFQAQTEQTCFMLTELSVIMKEQRAYASELEQELATVAPLMVQERSLRVQFLQLDEESIKVSSLNPHP